jgi:hypothetical protein
VNEDSVRRALKGAIHDSNGWFSGQIERTRVPVLTALGQQ